MQLTPPRLKGRKRSSEEASQKEVGQGGATTQEVRGAGSSKDAVRVEGSGVER